MGFEASVFVITACFILFPALNYDSVSEGEESLMLYHLFSSDSQSACSNHKAEQGRIIFHCESEDLCCSHICQARDIKVFSFKISVRQCRSESAISG